MLAAVTEENSTVERTNEHREAEHNLGVESRMPLKEGKDVIHIAFTSGLSGTYNSTRIAAEELQEEYPERKIVVIDSLCAAMEKECFCIRR